MTLNRNILQDKGIPRPIQIRVCYSALLPIYDIVLKWSLENYEVIHFFVSTSKTIYDRQIETIVLILQYSVIVL